ncbi:hypothetical protein GGH96_005441 [Coemansia sp. RSA 1972]|nr:hypothetical protein GGH96_005441 [Coemansia sp. RSA 1972]
MKQQRDLKNTIQYTCGMCSVRVIIPGSTRSALKEAKLDAKTHRTDTAQRNNEAMNIKVPQADTAAVASGGQPARKSEHPHTPTPTAQLAGSTKITATIQADTATKKRKRNKSNLLATVAANKKKVEEKKNADSSTFSLNDFLSSL